MPPSSKPPRGRREVLTTDALVEGVHFDRAFVPPDAIGHRALAVNLSDLAAMGAEPRAALLSLALPGGLPGAFLDGFLDGFLRHAAAHRTAILGGNITQHARSARHQRHGHRHGASRGGR